MGRKDQEVNSTMRLTKIGENNGISGNADLSQNGKLLATVNLFGFYVWNAETGEQFSQLAQPDLEENNVYARVTLSTDGKYAVTSNAVNIARIFI